jgi:hypothetical protein
MQDARSTVVIAVTPTRHSVMAVEMDVIARTRRRQILAVPTGNPTTTTRIRRHPTTTIRTRRHPTTPTRRRASTVLPTTLVSPIGTMTEVVIQSTTTQGARSMAVTAVTPARPSVMAMGLSAHAWIPRHPTMATRTTTTTTTQRPRRYLTTRTHQPHTTTTQRPRRQASTKVSAERTGTVIVVVIQSTTTQSARSTVVTAATPTRHSVTALGRCAHVWIPLRPTTTRTTILRPHRLPIGTTRIRRHLTTTTPPLRRRVSMELGEAINA